MELKNTTKSGQAGWVRYCCKEGDCNEGVRFKNTDPLNEEPYDIAIIGAGVVGCALAYELSQYQSRVILIEKAFDVGEGTSKANSAIIHTGFDAAAGSLESELVSSASREWPDMAQKLKVPMVQTGAIVLAFSEDQQKQLAAIQQKSVDNGVTDNEILDATTVRRLEPNVNPNVRGGLRVPRESIIDPFAVSIAFAEVALSNGTDILFGAEVNSITETDQSVKTVHVNKDLKIRCNIIINVAGLWSRAVADQYKGEAFHINPRRGQFLLYDKTCRKLIEHILLPIPTKKTKGKLIAPTIFGNILTGPTAEDLPYGSNDANDTTQEGLEEIEASTHQMCPSLADQPVIAAYAGLRCNCQEGSYFIRFNDMHPGIVTVTGIRSTGLTSSFMLARYIIDGMKEQSGLNLIRNTKAKNSRDESSWPGWWKPPYENEDKLASCPDYGKMICYCENISSGELRDALCSPLSPQTTDALKRRTRAHMGRCQGFNCGVPIIETVRDHSEIPMASVTKRGPGSNWISPQVQKEAR